jgi:hypothetical protein
MLNAAQCQALAKEYKELTQKPDIPADRVTLLNNVAQSLKRLATQLDMLAANERDGKRPLQSVHSDRPGAGP